MKRLNSLFAVALAGFLSLCPVSSIAQSPTPPAQASDDDHDTQRIRLRQGDLPAVTLTRDVLFQLLVAELSGHRGDFDRAAEVFIGLTRSTLDPRLAQRAFQAAMAGRNMELTSEAAQLWAQLEPDNAEAQASSLALAASDGETEGLAAALAERIDDADDTDQAILQASTIVSKLQDKKTAFKVLDQAIGSAHRDRAMARMALADAAWGAQDAERAYSEARHALRLDPNLDMAAYRVLEYGLEVNADRAIKQTRDWLGEHPDARKLRLMLISRLVDRQEFSEALDLLASMREHSPEDFDLLYTEAEVLARAGEHDKAEALLDEYISVQTQRRQSLRDDQTNARADASDARLLLVRIAEEQENYEKALEQLDQIDDPALAFQARVHKAVLQGRMKDLQAARKTLREAEPSNQREESVIALTQAAIYRDAGRSDEAIEVLVDANEALPDMIEIKYDLAMMYERQGRLDKLESLLREVIELDPENANAYNALGYTLANHDQRLEEAEALLDRALDLEPDNPYILDSVGWYFYRVGELDTAAEYLERSYRKMPSAEVAAHLGEVHWMRKDRDEARRIWQEGLEQEPDNPTLTETLERLEVTLP